MLKKLVKYGNSTALVLDKAILELLGMAEGSVVKIKTDGVSLIITPQEKVEALGTEPVDPEKVLAEASRKMHAEHYQIEPSVDDMNELGQALMQVNLRYKPLVDRLTKNADYLEAVAKLQKKYKNPEQYAILGQEILALQKQYVPEYEDYQKELTAIQEAFDKKFGAKKPVQPNTMAIMTELFRARFADPKQIEMMHKDMALQNNEEYRHELMLLAEKYQHNLSSSDYINAFKELRYKYIPEARELDEATTSKLKSLTEL